MLSTSAARTCDYVVIGIAGVGFLLCLAAAAFAVPWRASTRASKIHREFSLFWRDRLLLQLIAAAWLAVQVLRLPTLWTPDSQLVPASQTAWTSKGLLCRIYLTLSLGLLQPLFLLTAALLCKMSLSRRKPAAGQWANSWVLALALAATIPVLILQSVVAWASLIVGTTAEESRGSLLHYLIATHTAGTAEECGGEQHAGCALCRFPAVSSMVSVAFALVYLFVIRQLTSRMLSAAINRRLQRRLRCFQVTLFIAIPLGEALRSCTVITNPFNLVFEVLWLLYFLTIPVTIAAASWLLVVIPAWEARCAMQEKEIPWDDSASNSERPQELVLLVQRKPGPGPPPSPTADKYQQTFSSP
ncbi:hypothetical protein WJX72_003805 [[Myrmecia] bisecta]|uniref:Uncharacterized protein n=1 Tax=[Myrmecia] bisecta TaxID=41462 RepID=A0AAW1QBR6_9CHLO